MQKQAILIMTVLMTGCAKTPKDPAILWKDPVTLPATDAPVNIGVAGAVVGIIKGQLLIAGGANFPDGYPWEGGQKVYQKTAYLYSIEGHQLDLVSEFPWGTEIAYCANYSDGQHLYTAGGEDKNGATDQVFKYSLDAQHKLHRDTLPSLPLPLTNAALVAAQQDLYFVGGENAASVSNQIYRLNAKDQRWDDFMELPYPISNAVVVSNNADKLFIVGGRKKNVQAKSDLYDELLAVDLARKTIKSIAKLPRALAAGTGIYFQDHIILFGGDDASTFHQVEDALAKISATADPLEKDSLIAAKNKLQVNHPGFRTEVIAYDLVAEQWKDLGKVSGHSPVTTTAVLQDDLIVIPSGEIRAGVRTDQILIGQIK